MYIALFLLLIFYDALEARVPMMNYWDEAATILVLCWGLYSFCRNPRMEKRERNGWIFLVVLVLIGALGNVVHPGLQTSFAAIVKDVAALCKFPAIFFVLQRRESSAEKQEKILPTIAKLSRGILLVTLAGVLVGRFVDLGFYTGQVRIVPTFQFVFSHPSFYISSCVMLAAVLIAESIRKNRIFLLLDCFLIFMAQRSKGYIFIAFLVMVVLLGEKRITRLLTMVFGTEKEKMKPGRLLLALAAVLTVILVVGMPQIRKTLQYGLTVPRTVLHVIGLQILVDFFPLGSGLGTFASHLSGEYYSNIYDLYGISNVVGMTRKRYHFISDVFWPYIYGQFGVFGLLIYIGLMVDIFFRQYRSKIAEGARIALAVVWVYALIATTSEAYFTNGTGVQMALFLSFFIGYGGRKEPENVPASE